MARCSASCALWSLSDLPGRSHTRSDTLQPPLTARSAAWCKLSASHKNSIVGPHGCRGALVLPCSLPAASVLHVAMPTTQFCAGVLSGRTRAVRHPGCIPHPRQGNLRYQYRAGPEGKWAACLGVQDIGTPFLTCTGRV